MKQKHAKHTVVKKM